MTTVRDAVRRVLATVGAGVFTHRERWRLAVAAGTAGAVLAAGAATLAGPWDGGQRTTEQARAAAAQPAQGALPDAKGDGTAQDSVEAAEPAAPPRAAAVLLPLGGAGEGTAVAPGRAEALRSALAPLLDDPDLGEVAVSVVDVASGEELVAVGAGRAGPPASTVKLVTGAAALRALGPEHVLVTRAVYDEAANRVVLVGGGDPTLTVGELTALAEATAAALAGRGVDGVAVGYDANRFSGPETRHPIGVNENIAPLTSLMLNAGRLTDDPSGPAPRASDPAAGAAAAFVRQLGAAGLTVRDSEATEHAAPAGAETVAEHHSAPVGSLVERMLTDSDNDLAEALARQVAVAAGEEPSLAGASRAMAAELEALGLPLDGLRLVDGSGLDRDGRLSARLLATLLATAAEPGHPELRPLLTGMPVAGFTGTLHDRFGDGAAGVVRAKTGTLTGVNTLAGTTIDADGRVLAFAFLARDTTSPWRAEPALDRAAAALTG